MRNMLKKELSPIVLFVYNRPEHTKRTIDALSRCEGFEDSDLYIFSDGPKPGEEENVERVRDVIERYKTERVTIIKKESNQGLAKSIISGVSEICNRYGKAIVLEDDLMVSSGFLRYMNSALMKYENEERVMQISGFMVDTGNKPLGDTAFFLPFTTSWGWGVWQRSWKYLDESASYATKIFIDSRIRNRFNLGGAYNYSKMLKRQLDGEIDSWAIRWYLSVFSQNGTVLHPSISLVNNEGFDGSGTHGWRSGALKGKRKVSIEDNDLILPDTIFEDPTIYRWVTNRIRWDRYLGYIRVFKSYFSLIK